MTAGRDPETLVRRFYAEVWEQADEAAARAILHPDLAFRGSLESAPRDRDGFLAYLREIHAALAAYRCRIDDLIVTGDRAAARMTFAGRHQGALFGVAATGRSIEWAGAAFFRVAEGRLAEIWVLGDIDAVKRQLAGD